MVGRLWAALAGGFLLGLTAYLLVSIFTETPQPMVFLVGWVAFGLLVALSQRPWSNTWATMAVASFLFPVLSFFATINLSARDPIVQTSDAAAAGAALGSIVVGGVAGFFGFFMGIAFALLAFFTRRQ